MLLYRFWREGYFSISYLFKVAEVVGVNAKDLLPQNLRAYYSTPLTFLQ